MTHYAVLTAIVSLGRVMFGPLSGWCVAHFGWPGLMLIAMSMGGIPLWCLTQNKSPIR